MILPPFTTEPLTGTEIQLKLVKTPSGKRQNKQSASYHVEPSVDLNQKVRMIKIGQKPMTTP